MIGNKFRILNDLGAGATAEVKCVEDVATGEQLACKLMRIDQHGQVPEVALAEAMIGFKMNHPNIINIKGIGRGLYDNLDGQPQIEVAYILMENMKQGELLNVLMNSGKFSESTARYFFKQILSAMSYMHNTVGVCHRDLKLDNILLDENFNMKLADLGFAISSQGHTGDGKLHSYKGTKCYMTPEQLDQRSYCGKQADLFAAAVILFMMVFEKRPFDEAKVSDPFYQLIAGNRA